MSYEQFCLLFGQKDQVFVPQDMPRHIQGTKTTTILFEKQTRRARQIFAPVYSKYLNIATAMLYVLFTNIHQKSARAEMHITHDDNPLVISSSVTRAYRVHTGLNTLISIPKIETISQEETFMKSQVIRILSAVGIAVLLTGGWFFWETQMNETPQTLPIPVAEAAIHPFPSNFSDNSPDVLIDKVITLSGLQKQIDQVPEDLLKDMHHYPEKPDDPMIIAELERIVIEVYKPEIFYEHVHNAIKHDFNRKYLETLIQMYNTPLLHKITEIESREFDFQAFEAFIEGVIRTSLPPNRLRLLQELESETRTTEFAVELSISTRRALLTGASGNNAEAIQSFDASIDAQKNEIRENTYQIVILALAFSYQEITDLELDEYIQFYQTEEGRWFVTHTVNGLLEAFRTSSLQTGKRIAELAAQKKLKFDTSKADHLLIDPDTPLNRTIDVQTAKLPASTDTTEEWETGAIIDENVQSDAP